MNKVNYLIVSNTVDYSTDLICLELKKRGLNYLRINRDKFLESNVVYNLFDNSLTIEMCDEKYVISDNFLKSVYFRAPVFLRNSKTYCLTDQLYRSQWSAFIRNLIVFDECKWVNHPVFTYKAENKMYQLKMAKEVGFLVPETIVGNYSKKFIETDDYYIVKSLDTALFYEGNQELFTYSIKMSGDSLNNAALREAPVIIQKYLDNKIDIRVTVIGNQLYPVKITRKNHGIDGDWRKIDKELLEYTSITLPLDIENKIHRVMKKLNLQFGGMDLILSDDKYYFIEVNPTGEWGWLKYSTKMNIDLAIVDCLTS